MIKLEYSSFSQLAFQGHAQNTNKSEISLVVYNVVPLLIGPPARALMTLIVYHVGEGTRPFPFPVTGNGNGQVTEPKGNHLVMVIWA